VYSETSLMFTYRLFVIVLLFMTVWKTGWWRVPST